MVKASKASWAAGVVAWGMAAISIAGDEATCPPPVPVPTISIDSVEASHGREVAGEVSISAEHRGFRYQFATVENAERFREQPEQFEVMWGGACGRMGPLSGKGHPTLYAVHDGRVFLFASKVCRETFLKDPTLCVEGDEPVPTGNQESARRAWELIEVAVQGMGGAERVDALRSWREHWSEKAADDPSREDCVTLTLLFPGAAHLREAWGEHEYERFVRDGRGAFRSSDGVEAMDLSQVTSMKREQAHHPLVILRARKRADFVCAMAEPGEVDGVKVERVAVHFDGALTTLNIDPATGRILATEYHARGKRSLLGEVRRRYSDFRELNGITAAFGSSLIWNGEPLASGTITLDSVESDVEITPELFEGVGG